METRKTLVLDMPPASVFIVHQGLPRDTSLIFAETSATSQHTV